MISVYAERSEVNRKLARNYKVSLFNLSEIFAVSTILKSFFLLTPISV